MDNSMDREVKKAKRFQYVAFGCVCLLIAIVVGLLIYPMTKPLSDSVTTGKLKLEASETNGYILAKAGDAYYETNASDSFGSLFAFEDWTLVSDKPTGEICVSLRFAELYILELYDDGYAAVYDGYASRSTIPYAYYKIPETVSASVTDYLRQNGIPREMGDGAIGMGTFSH